MSFSSQSKLIEESPYFDSEWYRGRYPDVVETGLTPPEHYLRIGGRLSRDPGPQFSTSAYSEKYPDVAQQGYNALLHYEQVGRIEKRTVFPSTDVFCSIGESNSRNSVDSLDLTNMRQSVGPSSNLRGPAFGKHQDKEDSKVAVQYLEAKQEVLASGFWDEIWYLKNYAQSYRKWKSLQKSNREPLDHYLKIGYLENNSPSEAFKLSGFQKSADSNPISLFLAEKRPAYQFRQNHLVPTERRVSEYIKVKSQRKSKKVVYCCIIGGYDHLIQHFNINDEWDYVCYTDDQNLVAIGNFGIWETRHALRPDLPADRRNRYHKINPHLFFESYEESIYIDGNINIISDYIFSEIEERGVSLLLPEHFARDCVYDEVKALYASGRTSASNKELLTIQLEFLQAMKFPKQYGLTENNLVYRRHHVESIRSIMERWWKILCDFTSRDQLGLAYSLWREGISPRDVTFPNTRYLYSDFWMFEHRHEHNKPSCIRADSKIYPAFTENSVPVVLSCNESFVAYLGVVITSIAENSNVLRNYDIVVLERDLSDGSKLRIAGLARENISIRFHNMNQIFAQLAGLDLHVEGYVPAETYNKIFLSEIMEGFGKVLYIDTDVVVRSDIAHLYDIDLFGRAIGASRNVANIHAARQNSVIKGQKFGDYLEDVLGVREFEKYFQAGILIIDMKSRKVRDLVSLGLAKLQEIKQPIFFDQCVFNSVFYDDVFYFSSEWNHVWYLQNYSYLRHTLADHTFFDYAKSRLDPKIVHYASKDKPTNKLDWRLKCHFWSYAARSPYFSELVEQVGDSFGSIPTLVELLSEPKPRTLVHLHVYYIDQISYMVEKLKNISGTEWDLVITSNFKEEDFKKAFHGLTPSVQFMATENKGFDALPFLKVLESRNLSQYDFVMKLHTKNFRPESEASLVYGRPVPGYKWRDDLVDALLISSSKFEDSLLRFEAEPGLGMLACSDYVFTTEENREQKTYNLRHWLNMYGIEGGTRYVGGTMFIARAYPFERFKRFPSKDLDFAAGDSSSGSHKNLAHVFERLFGMAVENERLAIGGT
ncbi:MAG: Lipopolysaccharide biosynthesis protein LPS:glycosyltransferase [Cypionkella sp.]|uniref:glycosyltransferase n=1 Tax=Cypionkella sp. TaxID=2811411 RepID=UPI00262A42F8|nr:glycosyltransferase [Cypionkella sp.]MDB5660706.1 Lipopolysaccharide biosynthesis protein LPS:glycosyltransferase [Cypionkella sp.]